MALKIEQYAVGCMISNGYATLTMRGSVMGCCGLGDMSNMSAIQSWLTGNARTPAETPEAVLAAMYLGHMRYCANWNFIMCATTGQLTSYDKLKAFLDKYCHKMGEEFANENHGPNKLFIYRLNLKEHLNKVFNGDGVVIDQEAEKKRKEEEQRRKEEEAVKRAEEARRQADLVARMQAQLHNIVKKPVARNAVGQFTKTKEVV